MMIIGFRRLLMSRYGGILQSDCLRVSQNMSLPLHCYFINSSHNTYLTGPQMHGEATIEGYISALKSGTRLVERKYM